VARLSVAIWPPPEIIRIVGGLRREPLRDVRWSLPEQWLLKLRPLGHVADSLAGPLIEALAAELADAEPPTCVLGPATRRIGGQRLGVPVSGVDDLSAVVFDATVDLVPVTHPQPFQADIVIARGRVPASLAGETIEGEWAARTAALVADRSAPGRPRFDNLAEFRLGGGT
jgi:2'-5' RNA ligase